MTTPKYNTLFYSIGALLSVVTAAIFWFSLMWFVAGSDMLQMWMGAHVITVAIGFGISFGLSVVQAEHIPEVIYRATQLGSKVLFLIPMSTGFRAISDTVLPSDSFSLGNLEISSAEMFAYTTVLAMVLFLLFTITSWLAEKRAEKD
ncbi:hypothetical protein DYD21_15435 [Rhodohalobacter sp. SW132]|uniref:hypothetical protein n=1 Tax=Rhodohalobacter sp. SW132 TaxID=2293433 RepID=UPI000E3A32BA|nr:hypothetical protein [Rhodohalobacter sp. SW132]REL24916.1 hypothetical protein DYD21_15435 [Rhodohalobacter sp. SW132]